jgi:hypothetical protein
MDYIAIGVLLLVIQPWKAKAETMKYERKK